jgi:E3 ubiquitin-protein ligase HUWE1
MLEKNFVATLTNALSEVDLNYPNVRGVVAAILRPLELLCVILFSNLSHCNFCFFLRSKIAIKMSRVSGKAKDSAEGRTESIESLGSEEDDEDIGREETPDLYRNSALGMYVCSPC